MSRKQLVPAAFALAALLGVAYFMGSEATGDVAPIPNGFTSAQDGPMPAQLAGFGASGGSAQSAPVRAPDVDGLRFRRYAEQNENAYSFEAPEGWTVRSQVLRRSATEYRTWDEITSPDGQVRLAGGLPDVYLFAEPGPMTQQMGWHEGSTIPGSTTQVARYQDGTAFARRHVQTIAGGCGEVQVTAQQERPDEVQRQIEKAQREGDWIPGIQMSAGEVRFTCQGAGGPMEGRVIAATGRLEQPGVGATWFGGLRGYLAPASRAEDAYRILEHVVRSHEPNPQWKARQRQAQQAQQQASQRAHQQRMAASQAQFNAHQQRMASQQQAFDARNQAWQANQNANDRQHDQFIDYLRDETNVVNPSTGQAYKVESGYDTYWQGNDGTIVGTPGYVDNPDPTQYQQMYEGYDDGNQ